MNMPTIWNISCTASAQTTARTGRPAAAKSGLARKNCTPNPLNRMHAKKNGNVIRRTRVDGYREGKQIHHPTFGQGIVEKIDRMENITILTIRFGETQKRFDIDWVRKHCE